MLRRRLYENARDYNYRRRLYENTRNYDPRRRYRSRLMESGLAMNSMPPRETTMRNATVEELRSHSRYKGKLTYTSYKDQDPNKGSMHFVTSGKIINFGDDWDNTNLDKWKKMWDDSDTTDFELFDDEEFNEYIVEGSGWEEYTMDTIGWEYFVPDDNQLDKLFTSIPNDKRGEVLVIAYAHAPFNVMGCEVSELDSDGGYYPDLYWPKGVKVWGGLDWLYDRIAEDGLERLLEDDDDPIYEGESYDVVFIAEPGPTVDVDVIDLSNGNDNNYTNPIE